MASIFEKTMQACLESKKTVSATPKNNKAKNLIEKKKVSRMVREAEEDDDTDIDEEEMATADDIMAVIDPELDADEMTSVAQGFQQLINDTPDNEIPETDEYVDDNIYGCPICGAKFFWDGVLGAGDTCPVCGEESADGFVKAGEVEATESESKESDDEPKKDDVEVDGEFDIDGEEIDVEVTDEKKKARKEGRRISRRPMARKESMKVSRRGMNLDEKSFNIYLNKFVKENFNNAKSFAVVGARQKGRKLSLECKITFNSGKAKKVTLEGMFNPKSKYMLAKDKNNTFKAESKKAPFMFKVRTVGSIVRCEGMRYNYTTTAKVKNENKKVQVSGNYMTENRKVRKPMARKTVESRKAIRRPLNRRTVESRRIARRPLARRSMRTESKIVRRPLRTNARRVSESRRTLRRPTCRVGEARKIARKPVMRRESSRVARRVARPTMRREGVRPTTRRVARPSIRRVGESRRVVRRPLKRTESVRKPVARRRSVTAESRIAKRSVARRNLKR